VTTAIKKNRHSNRSRSRSHRERRSGETPAFVFAVVCSKSVSSVPIRVKPSSPPTTQSSSRLLLS
jgi:hypothetical protein